MKMKMQQKFSFKQDIVMQNCKISAAKVKFCRRIEM